MIVNSTKQSYFNQAVKLGPLGILRASLDEIGRLELIPQPQPPSEEPEFPAVRFSKSEKDEDEQKKKSAEDAKRDKLENDKPREAIGNVKPPYAAFTKAAKESQAPLEPAGEAKKTQKADNPEVDLLPGVYDNQGLKKAAPAEKPQEQPAKEVQGSKAASPAAVNAVHPTIDLTT